MRSAAGATRAAACRWTRRRCSPTARRSTAWRGCAHSSSSIGTATCTRSSRKLLTYALGRHVDYRDQPAIRRIVRDAAAAGYRWSAIILGIVYEHAVPDGKDRAHDDHQEGAVAPHRAQGAGRRGAAAVPRCDGAGADRAAADARRSRGCGSARSTCRTASSRASGFRRRKASAFEFSPTLKPLEPFRDRLLVISGLDSVPPPPPGERQYNNHADASTRFLTDVTPSRTLRAGVSIDQILAKAHRPGHGAAVAGARAGVGGFRDVLRLRPQLRLHRHHRVGRADVAAADGARSERGVRAPVRRRHRRCEGARRRACSKRAASSIRCSTRCRACRASVSAADRSRMSGYLESVRDVERRIQKAVAHKPRCRRSIGPAGMPDTFEQHARLMFDLQLLAYQGDVTRVVTFMIGREFSGRTYPEIGVPDAHHPISHHQRDPVRMEKCAKINHYHVSLFCRVRREDASHARRRRLAARSRRPSSTAPA